MTLTLKDPCLQRESTSEITSAPKSGTHVQVQDAEEALVHTACGRLPRCMDPPLCSDGLCIVDCMDLWGIQSARLCPAGVWYSIGPQSVMAYSVLQSQEAQAGASGKPR